MRLPEPQVAPELRNELLAKARRDMERGRAGVYQEPPPRYVRIVAEPGNGSRYELECYQHAGETHWHIVMPVRWGGVWRAFHFDHNSHGLSIYGYCGLDNEVDCEAIAKVLHRELCRQDYTCALAWPRDGEASP